MKSSINCGCWKFFKWKTAKNWWINSSYFERYYVGVYYSCTVNCDNLNTTFDGSIGQNLTVGGYISASNQVSFRAIRISLNIIINTTTSLPFNDKAHNIGGHYNTSTYKFTAPISETYFLNVSILRDFLTPDNNKLQVVFFREFVDGSTQQIEKLDYIGVQKHFGEVIVFF